MHLELRQRDSGRWQMALMPTGSYDHLMSSGHYEKRVDLDDDLARMAKALGEGGAARIPVVTVHEHGGQDMLAGRVGGADVDGRRADGALHATKGSVEFASLADWLPRGE